MADVTATLADPLAAVANALAELTGGDVAAEPDRSPRTAAPHSVADLGRRHYRILRELGRGGMGIVYLAQRTDGPLVQHVALKLIASARRGDDLVRSRFGAEQVILSRLDHPNIARILDAGTTSGGLPYFVMEPVDGVAIDAYCVQQALPVRERLRLFHTLASAVQYAHQSLVVHRDLKPGNVLVTASGTPKILDFGIAKLLDSAGDSEEPLHDDRPMTPRYASPEQVRGEPITTASDVYSLGVMLYELLTGVSPYGRETRTRHELACAVLAHTPPRPSTLLGSNGREHRAFRLARRRHRPAELDAIVLKAISKAPADRYASAGQLAEDLAHHLDDLPVLAYRGSLAYRAGKLLHRHRLASALAAAFGLLVLAFGVHLRWQLQRTQLERDKAREVARLLEEVFSASDPRADAAAKPSARELLDRGSKQVAAELSTQPEVKAALLVTLGRVYRNLGALPQARRHLEEAVELERRRGHTQELLDAGSYLALLLDDQAEYEASLLLKREMLALAHRLHGEESRDAAMALGNLAMSHYYLGQHAEAEPLYRRSLALRRRHFGSESLAVAEAVNNLATLLQQVGRTEEAEPLLVESLALRRRLRGPNHAEVAESLNNLAWLYHSQERLDEAEPLYREGIEITRRTLGEAHPTLGFLLNNLGNLRARQGRPEEAEAPLVEALALRRGALGLSHPDTAITAYNLADVHYQAGRFDRAEPLYREAVEIWRRALPEGHANTAFGFLGLGRLLCQTHRLDEGEPLLRRAIAVGDAALPAGHFVPPVAEAELGACLGLRRQFAEADALVREGLRRLETSLGGDHARTRRARQLLAELESRRAAAP